MSLHGAPWDDKECYGSYNPAGLLQMDCTAGDFRHHMFKHDTVCGNAHVDGTLKIKGNLKDKACHGLHFCKVLHSDGQPHTNISASNACFLAHLCLSFHQTFLAEVHR